VTQRTPAKQARIDELNARLERLKRELAADEARYEARYGEKMPSKP
jgi:hypothetical protein